MGMSAKDQEKEKLSRRSKSDAVEVETLVKLSRTRRSSLPSKLRWRGSSPRTRR